MTGFSMYEGCLRIHSFTSIAEKYYCTRHSGVSLTRKPATREKKITIMKYRRSDPICSTAVMKLAQSALARIIYVTRIMPNISMKDMQLRSTRSQRFVCVVA